MIILYRITLQDINKILADGREVQEAVPHAQGARDCLVHAGVEEVGHRGKMHSEVLQALHKVTVQCPL